MLTREDLQSRMVRGDVKHVVVGSEHVGKFAEIGGEYSRICVGASRDGWISFADSQQAPLEYVPDAATMATDPLLLYFTSGTTSQPKLVLHTHQSYPVGHLSTMYWIGLQPGDIHLNISSPGWAKHAWSCFFAPWNAGACIFLYNYSRFNAAAMLAVLEKYQITTMCAPPTVWRMMIQADLSAYRDRIRIRELIGAGEPLNPEVIDQIKSAWGITIRDGFGQTETTAVVGNSPGQVVKPGSMGRPLPGYKVMMVDSDNQAVAEGEVAIVLDPRPTGLMTGYFGDEAKTAEVMRGGVYRTGDVAQVDEDGYITYVGRADDVFKASDYRISPFELESVAIEHPAVAEAAVVPSPDPVRLAVPKAFIVLRQGYQPSRELAKDIFGFLRANLAPYKRIRRIEFADLPKTISGKIRRVELKANEAETRAAQQKGNWEFFEEDFPELKE
jgi:acetyl-CoA synthetase